MVKLHTCCYTAKVDVFVPEGGSKLGVAQSLPIELPHEKNTDGSLEVQSSVAKSLMCVSGTAVTRTTSSAHGIC